CLLVTLSPCHLVTLSPCHLVTLSPCLLVSLSPCLLVSLSPCLLVRMKSEIADRKGAVACVVNRRLCFSWRSRSACSRHLRSAERCAGRPRRSTPRRSPRTAWMCASTR